MDNAVLLISPQYPFNVSGVLRACAIFGASTLAWTDTRVLPPDTWPEGARLPREERMKVYEIVRMLGGIPEETCVDRFKALGYTPVAVERRHRSEQLPEFVHPEEKTLYVFGPEDGSIPKAILHACHRFVCIPTFGDAPLNLAAAANVVLYDRMVKELALTLA